QNFDYLLVLDFEATCCDDGKILPYQEIIEFPVAKLDVRSWTVNSYFHQYVKPTVNPVITSFCTHLTGIIQEMVDEQPTIDRVLSDFDDWLKKGRLHSGIDDVKTICSLTSAIAQEGYVFRFVLEDI
ncbi:exonuclease, partial [Ostertagia ostertagi]